MHMSFKNLRFVSIQVLFCTLVFNSCNNKKQKDVDTDFYIEIVSANPTCAKCDIQLAQLNALACTYHDVVTVEYIQPFLNKKFRNQSENNELNCINVMYNSKLYQMKGESLELPYLLFRNKEMDTIQIDYKWNFDLLSIESQLSERKEIPQN